MYVHFAFSLTYERTRLLFQDQRIRDIPRLVYQVSVLRSHANGRRRIIAQVKLVKKIPGVVGKLVSQLLREVIQQLERTPNSEHLTNFRITRFGTVGIVALCL